MGGRQGRPQLGGHHDRHLAARHRHRRLVAAVPTSLAQVPSRCQEPGIGAVFPGTGQPIPVQGRWLASVVRGHFAYYAVPGNTDAVAAFRTQATRHWYKALRRRSQRPRVNWERMNRHATRWLPPARVMHPFPDARFDARTRGRSPVR